MAQKRRDVPGRMSDGEDLERLMVSVVDDKLSANWPEQH
jgi:hypothetical protein